MEAISEHARSWTYGRSTKRRGILQPIPLRKKFVHDHEKGSPWLLVQERKGYLWPCHPRRDPCPSSHRSAVNQVIVHKTVRRPKDTPPKSQHSKNTWRFCKHLVWGYCECSNCTSKYAESMLHSPGHEAHSCDRTHKLHSSVCLLW